MSAAKEAAYKAGQLDAGMTTIDNMLKELAGDTFSYDAQSDPRYALAKEYAKQAMDAQMAESALLSGGYGNSYAAASGQQVYTDYMNDAVNDMEDRAYSMWSAERSDKYNQLGLAMQLENQEYTREQDARTKADADKAAAQERVENLLAMGSSVAELPAELVAASGYTEQELAQFEKYFQNLTEQENAANTPTYTPTLSANAAYEHYLLGNHSSGVMAAMRYYFGDDFADYFGAQEYSELPTPVLPEVPDGTEDDLDTDAARNEKFAIMDIQRSYDTAKSKAQSLILKGDNDAAYYALVDSGLNSDQIMQIMDELKIKAPEA